MGYSCCIPGCKSIYKKDELNGTVFKFPSILELRKNCYIIYLKSLTNSSIHESMVCTEHFEV